MVPFSFRGDPGVQNITRLAAFHRVRKLGKGTKSLCPHEEELAAKIQQTFNRKEAVKHVPNFYTVMTRVPSVDSIQLDAGHVFVWCCSNISLTL